VSDPARRRGLGLWMCTALVVGNMIGSGVFLLPASLAQFGGISILGWLFSAGGAVCLALVFARLAMLLPKIGGPYAFAREGFGDFGGFLMAWSYWIAIVTADAALAVAGVSYLTIFWPALAASPLLGAVAAVGVLWLLTLVNLRGVHTAGQLTLVTTILKVLPLVAIGVFGLLAFNAEHFTPFNRSGSSPIAAISATVTLTLWAFTGLESGTVPAADVHDPARTIPRATILGTLIAAAIYILSTVSVMGIIDPAELATSTAPFADAARRIWGPWGHALIGAGAAISCFGALNGWLLLSGQLPRAAALDGLLPARLATVNARGTPAFSLVLSTCLTMALVMMNYTRGLVQAFTFMILLATLATLLPYVFSSMTAVLFTLRERSGTGRAALRLIIAVIGFAFSLWAIAGAGRDVVYWGFLLLLAGLPIYILMRRKLPLPEPVVPPTRVTTDA
jgi:APA family basic amino acid/polyamine antiporter